MQATMIVKGMTARSNEATVRGTLEALEGVQGTEVYLDTEKVDITFDEAFITPKELRKAIEAQGFSVIT
ncbi:heavy-metal-associated domain-containing protein [Virgibacillus sp. W0430]|uniref:heavy-metal-associated domain-containing protein n=1 Tax=Virgibacillus sp. W0430 TaxID=3391580 RepID=UPI003F481BAD